MIYIKNYWILTSFQPVKCFQVLLFNTNSFISYSCLHKAWRIDRCPPPIGITNMGQSGPWSNGNEGVLPIHQSPSNEPSPSDGVNVCKEVLKILDFRGYEGHTISFQTFFVWSLLLIVHIWNSSPLRSSLLRLQCTCFNVPTTSGRPNGIRLVWSCQWPLSQCLSSPQLSHNSLWAYRITKSHREQGLDYSEGEKLS